MTSAGPVESGGRVRVLSGVTVAIALCVAAVTAVSPPPAGTGSSVAVAQESLAPVVAGHRLARRLVYLSTNFQVDTNVAPLKSVISRANAAGFNGAVVTDVKFGRLDDGTLIPRFYTNLLDVLSHAAALDFAMIPATAYYGYSSPLLWHNPNLAEGLPVRDAPFLVQSGRLVPDPAGSPPLVNGNFESVAAGDRFAGWAFQDEPGTATFVDRDVKHGGTASLRMEDLGTTNPVSGNGRVYQRLQVAPFRNYHVSVWVRTADFRGGEVRVLVLGTEPTQTLQWNPVPVQPTQDWTRFDVTFNSLSYSEVLLYLGVWSGRTGTIWWDDATLEPAGLVNTVRRPGAPARITDLTGATTFEEGRDIARLEDPLMGRVPYPGVYALWHQPPEIVVPAGSRLSDGEKVLVSHYHTASVYGDQVTASLLEPESLQITADQVRAVNREFSKAAPFGGWMFSHDEIRVGGWDEAPVAGTGSPGETLAANFRALREAARGVDADAPVFVWSDMFDPHHNAADTADPYYLVNGNWSGSWEGLDEDVVIMNWNHGAQARASAAFFAGRGNSQVLAGYYDSSPAQFRDRQWLEELEGVEGVEGVMYTPWGSGYDNLEAWAEHVWGGADWVPPAPSATPGITPSPGASITPGTTASPGASPPDPTSVAPPSPTTFAAARLWLPRAYR